MRKAAVIILVALSLSVSAAGQAKPSGEADIRAVLERQQAAWNKGDVEGFMAYYWRSEALTFQSGNSRTHGWEGVLARYKKNYPAGTMGLLEFSELEVHVLSADAAFVLGRFRLDQGGPLKEGVFTLVFRRTGEGWRIVHDHTSS